MEKLQKTKAGRVRFCCSGGRMCLLGYSVPSEAQTSPCGRYPMPEELQQKVIKECLVEASHSVERGNQNRGS